MQNDNNIRRLVKTLYCSCCGKDFDDTSMIFQGQHGELTVVKILCKHCEKDFAIAFMGLYPDEFNKTTESPEIIEAEKTEKCDPINFDDVLDAHQYIENIDDNWQRFISKKKDTYTI